ncbi:MAG: hypothetical protein ACLRH0_07100 [Blautia wexlerae]
MWDAIKPAIDIAVEAFKGWYENAEIVIEGIKDFLSGIITFLTGAFQETGKRLERNRKGSWKHFWNPGITCKDTA